MLDALASAVAAVTEPFALLMLLCGVFAGLVIGVIPGLGGIFGMALLIPLTYQLDPIAAFALLLGLGSVITTSDTVPAVLLGVPGSVGAIATVEDGYPLSKQNQAARAFGAAYSASMIGGVFGAILLAAAIPVIRPLILTMRTPDFLAIAVLGVFLVGVLSGGQPAKGILAALLGALCAYIGIDDQTATERFTFGDLYLWDGLPLATVFLGLFGLPALIELAGRERIARSAQAMDAGNMWRGIAETLREWRLVLSSSASGAILGAIPGIGLPVIEWVGYGIARRKRKGGPEFGQGNIRGVIGPESANNAKEGGALIPTIAFGLPGSASMTLLLGAFIVHGLVPGEPMLGAQLDITYSMVFFIALANVIATLLCLAFTKHLARIALVPSAIIIPVALVLVTLGAFHEHTSVKDIAVLLAFGLIGHFMKVNNWHRAAFSLGFVLGPSIERYFYLSQQLTDGGWVFRPSIIAVAGVGAFILLTRLKSLSEARRAARARLVFSPWDVVAALVLSALAIGVIVNTSGMPAGARQFPQVCAIAMLAVCAFLVAGNLRRLLSAEGWTRADVGFDLPRVAIVVVECAVFVAAIHLVGYLAAVAITVFGATALRVPLRQAVFATAFATALAYGIFGLLISVPWPAPLLGG